jgi:tetratricopeptide (TPR) repeat protein
VAKVRDFFISYTGADVAWAEWVAQTLEDAGYTTVLQAWDFRPGDNFLQRMDQALAEADRVLAVLSPAYFASEYTRDEWTAALVRARSERDRLLPVRIQAVELPDLLATRVYIDLVNLDERAAAEQLLAGVRPGRAKPKGRRSFPGGKARAGGASFPGRRPQIFEAPSRNRHFTGRSELLRALRRQLAATKAGAVVQAIQAGAVHGLGGVGKTQLVVEYAHRYTADYDLVWWVPAEQPATISGRLAALGRRLGLEELPSLEEQVGVVFDALGQRERWLLVYDNAQQPAHLEGLWPPSGGGHVLVTSRNPAWSGVATPIAVDVLPREQAVGFLARRIGSNDQATLGEVASVLGDLPLALEQAAAYMEETATTPEEYLGLLHDRAEELFTLGRPSGSKHTIATTWTVALERVRAELPAAEDLLCLCAFLAPDDLPRALLTDHADQLPKRLAGTVADGVRFPRATGVLRRYSLVAVTAEALSTHRLVQAVVRQRLSRAEWAAWVTCAVKLILAAWPTEAQLPAAWPRCGRLLPHALAAAEHAEDVATAAESTGMLLNEVGKYLGGRAEWMAARSTFERALSILEAAYGPDHPEVARTLDRLGIVHAHLEELPKARDCQERALAILEAAYGPDHPEVARTLDNLGNIYHRLGDLAKARDYEERALAILEATYGPDHPEVAIALGNLGSTLDAFGQVAEARAHHERALAIYEAAYGPDHPEVARSLYNLGFVLLELGESSQGRAYIQRALAIYEATYGPDHPRVALTLHTLGLVLFESGEPSQGRAYIQRALAIYETRLGPDHRDTRRTRADLAEITADIDHQK